ncbi:MAG: phosphatidate cytidylyltransferase [Candidatus Izimaplasma sp.]|nr:phosphatidate cytidylyltransferase [Candidatus Izimaplasma bacterium]
MKKRIITAFFLIVILGGIILVGEGDYAFLFSGVCVLLATVAAYEFSIRLNRYNKEKHWFHYIPILFTFLFTLGSIIFFEIALYQFIFIFLFFLTIGYLMLYILLKDFNKEDLAMAFLTILYSSIGFIALAFLRQIDLLLILFLLTITIMTDTFAYFLGIKYGAHKLAPKISPKKSIEGALSGLIFGALSGFLFAYFFEVFDYSVVVIIIISIAISIIAQSGDLIASKFKREVGIKDYSNIFPGHGGVLDRFDSALFAAVFLMMIIMVF